jgi:protein ImuB
MRRVISLWLPSFPTDRLRRCRSDAPSAETPFVTSRHDGHRRVIAAMDTTALALGLRPGLPLAQAQARVPGLVMVEATPAADAAALARLAVWCLRYAPLTAPDPPDGVWIDASGAAHLAGGEAALLGDLLARMRQAGFTARAAIADTPGAAHAVARYGAEPTAVVPPGEATAVLTALPVAALRLTEDTIEALRRLGLIRIEQLVAAPRAPLVRRFGPDLLLRLDQALGCIFEPITPVVAPELISRRLTFVEPLSTAVAFAMVIARLTRSVCCRLERKGLGARQSDLLFERVNGSMQAIRAGTARPVHDAAYLARLLDERLETVDPGPGIEAMRLTISLAEPLIHEQGTTLLEGACPPDLSVLVDRLGETRIYRVEPVESDVPERSVRRVPPLAPPSGRTWPKDLPRPARLLSPPQPVRALATLPDHPPVAFTWRRKRFRVRRADGPERIHGEWWQRDAERFAVRDYFQIEDEEGRRFWLFRRGDGIDTEAGNLDWFLHGIF